MRRLATMAVFCLVALAAAADRSSSARVMAANRPRQQGGSSLLLRVQADAPGSAFDRLRIELPKEAAQGASAGFLPPPWKLERKRSSLEIAGPATAGPLHLRIDLAGMAPLPTIEVKVLAGRRTLFADKKLAVRQEPALEVQRQLDKILRLPPLLTPGETIGFLPLNLARTPAAGRWLLAGVEAKPASGSGVEGAALAVQLPADLPAMGPVEVVYIDPWGERSVEASALEQVRVVPKGLPPSSKPRLTRCTAEAPSADMACVCGWFPDPAARGGVLIDGRPAGLPLAVSQRSLCFRAGLGPHRLTSSPSAGFSPGEAAEMTMLNMQISAIGEMRPGQSAPVTWTVTGTDEPVRLRIRNLGPAVATVEGGDAQTVVTSGGKPNVVTRTVTALAVGRFSVRAELEEGSAPSRSDEYLGLLVQAFQAELKRIAGDFAERVRSLPTARGGSLYRTADVLSALDATERDLLAALPYPELAAFRDAASERFSELRATIAGLPPAQAALPGIRKASWQQPASGHVEKKKAEPLLKSLLAFLTGSASRAPLRTLCVISTPEEQAEFRIFPESFPADERQTSTNAVISNLFVGKYRYRIRKQGFQAASFTLDLIRETQPVLECRLARESGQPVPCRSLARSVDLCRKK
jgi:hypothetical protein